MANWWDAAPLAETKTATIAAAPAAGANWWEAAPLAQEAAPAQATGGVQMVPGKDGGPTRVIMDMGAGPKPAGAVPADRGALDAGARGVASGLTANFSDEIRGLVEASGANPDDPASLSALIGGALKYWGGDTDAKKRYDTAAERERALTKTAEEQHPVASVAGNLVGAIALPVGAAGQAATLPGRMTAGAAVGAGFGGASGAGEGVGAADSISRGITGLAAGGALGGVAPAAIEGVVRGARALSAPAANAIRGIRDPDGEAARRVGLALQRDANIDPGAASRLTPAEFAASAQPGGPAAIMDMGGETTRALARSAANTSPEGRAALTRTIDDRFEGQSTRVTDWLRNTFHFPDAGSQSKALDDLAKSVNKPAYAKAYAQGRAGIWDSELSELSQAPMVQDAVNAALRQAQNKAATGDLSQAGLARWSNGGKPTLEFWDLVKRQIDQEVNVARRAGKNEDAATLTEVKNRIVGRLDEAVPSYSAARSGASKLFDAQDALEAGQNYVSKNVAANDVRRALAHMSPLEKQLFQDGFVSRFIETLERTGDRRSILNKIAESPSAREKLSIALGKDKAKELEAGLRVEGIMDLARSAVQGNSTTARQLAELGLAGGTYGLGTGGDILSPNPSALMNAALVYGAARGKSKINESVSRRVAEMLASKDPKVLARGVSMISKTDRFLDALRSADRGIARVSGQQAPTLPAQAGGAVRAEEQQPSVPRP